MRIACPACTVEYEVPADRIRPGRTVRCAKCGERWSPAGEAVAEPVRVAEPDTPVTAPAVTAAAPMEQPVMPVVEPPSEAAEPSVPVAPRRGAAGLTLAWLLTFAVLGGAAYAAVAYRSVVMQAWPPSARAYLALGFAR